MNSLIPLYGLDYTTMVLGGARGVIVIVVGNEHDNTSSNPGGD